MRVCGRIICHGRINIREISELKKTFVTTDSIQFFFYTLYSDWVALSL